jgi:long-chain acyl-CoA synthetase
MSNFSVIEQTFSRIAKYKDKTAVIDNNGEYTYSQLHDQILSYVTDINSIGVNEGAVVTVHADFSFYSCAMLFALAKINAIIVPLRGEIGKLSHNYTKISCASYSIVVLENGTFNYEKPDMPLSNHLLNNFRENHIPGLIIFTSGSTGEPKAVLHDLNKLINRFMNLKHAWKTIIFLMFDHLGGINTLFSSIVTGGTAICVRDRNPDTICHLIQENNADLLPTTPSFLNLLIFSNCLKNHDISSLRLITYGTEVMPDATLSYLTSHLPGVTLKQTYGTSEFSTLMSSSAESNSLWMKMGGRGCEIKIINDILWVKSNTSMVGYLNAPSPFDSDGWICTGDRVEQNGDLVKILGRESDIINVGGQKVFPSEVENLLISHQSVIDVKVYGAKHDLLGQVVHADLISDDRVEKSILIRELRLLCALKLERYKIPISFHFFNEKSLVGDRLKKIRNKG